MQLSCYSNFTTPQQKTAWTGQTDGSCLYLQVKLCDPCLSALRLCMRSKWSYKNVHFLSFPINHHLIVLTLLHFNFYQQSYIAGGTYNCSTIYRGGPVAMGRVLDLWSTGGGFKSYSDQRLHNNLWQVVHTYVPLSPSSITWYRPRGGDALRLGR